MVKAIKLMVFMVLLAAFLLGAVCLTVAVGVKDSMEIIQ
jgi:hypothetical protein